MSVRIRPAGAGDLPACQGVWEASALGPDVGGGEAELGSPAELGIAVELGGAGRPVINPLWAHELATGQLLAAEDPSGRLVGFAGAVVRSGRWFLGDLFVHPSCQAAGVGRALLQELMRHAPDRRATMASTDIAAQVLYIRAGMAPRWTAYTLVGELPARLQPPWLRVERVAGAEEAEELTAFDRRLSGVERGDDLTWWCEVIGAVPLWLVDESGGRRGYTVVADDYPAVLNPELRTAATVITALVDQPDLAIDAVTAAIGWATARGRPRVRLMVPGPHPALPKLLAAGFRVIDTDLFCASHDDLFDGRRGIPSITLL